MTERPIAIGLFREAVTRLGQGETTTAARLADRARELFLAAGDADGACAAAILRGRTALRSGRVAEGAEWFAWAREEALRRGLVPRVLAATSELAVVTELEGHHREALATHRGILEAQRNRDDNVGIAMAAGNVARLLPLLDPAHPTLLGEARALLEEALVRFRDGPHEAGVANTLVCLADHLRSQAALPEALEHLREVTQLSPTPMVQPIRALAWLNVGHVQRDFGHMRQAVLAYTEAVELFRVVGDEHALGLAKVALAMTQAQQLPVGPCVQSVHDVGEWFLRKGDFDGAASIGLQEGLLLGLSGRLRSAKQQLLRTKLQFDVGPDPRRIADVALALGWVTLPMANDRAMLRAIRLRQPRTPVCVRAAGLAHLAVRLRRLELSQFDALRAKWGVARRWQETVGLLALDVQRAALRGEDLTDVVLPVVQQAMEHDALVDAWRLQSAHAWALLWLGQTELAEQVAATASAGLERLGHLVTPLVGRMVQTLALTVGGAGVRPDRDAWRAMTARVIAESGARTVGHALAAAGQIACGDVDACDPHFAALDEAGDAQSVLLLRATRARVLGGDVRGHEAAALAARGVHVPDWLRLPNT